MRGNQHHPKQRCAAFNLRAACRGGCRWVCTDMSDMYVRRTTSSHAEAEAGQVVFHAHFHVIPRNKDDKLLGLPKGSPSMLEAAEAKQMAAKIQKHLDPPVVAQDASSIDKLVPVLAVFCAILVGVVIKLSAHN